eukprot:COSAG01_NODE_31963_length_588_cov_2.734151_1_plen_180_part_10
MQRLCASAAAYIVALLLLAASTRPPRVSAQGNEQGFLRAGTARRAALRCSTRHSRKIASMPGCRATTRPVLSHRQAWPRQRQQARSPRTSAGSAYTRRSVLQSTHVASTKQPSHSYTRGVTNFSAGSSVGERSTRFRCSQSSARHFAQVVPQPDHQVMQRERFTTMQLKISLPVQCPGSH